MKKGQLNPNPQSYISLLIFVIGVAVIIYILMLPPEYRRDLLDQNVTKIDDGEKDDITELLVVDQFRATNVPKSKITIDIPAFNLFSRTDAQILDEYQSLYIRKSLFSEESRNLTFKVTDPTNTDNYVLSFSSPKHEGVLSITLNGYTIYGQELQTSSPGPLKLQKDLIKGENVIVFTVSGPGILFWKTNQIILENIRLIADVTDKSAQSNKNRIVISEYEYENLESLELSFVVDCKTSEVSPLDINLNTYNMYHGIPDCGMPLKVPPVAPGRARQGENMLEFVNEKGYYSFYQVELALQLEKPLFPVYGFYLGEETYSNINKDKADINLTILFPNDIDRKKGSVLINGAFIEINTFDQYINKKINSFVRERSNVIEIRPTTEIMDVTELRVILAE